MADMLSQEEIDALLSGASDDVETAASNTEPPKQENLLTLEEMDAIGEIGNISMGSAATTLFTLLGQKVNITTPKVSETTLQDMADEILSPCVAITIRYKQGIHGANLLILQEKDVKIITDLIMGGDGTNIPEVLEDIHLSAISEAMNQMVGSSSTSLSEMLNTKIDISPPEAKNNSMGNLLSADELEFEKTEPIVKIAFRMTVGDLIDSEIMQLMPVEVAKQLVDSLMVSEPVMPDPKPVNRVAPEPAPAPRQAAPASQPQQMQQPPPQQQQMQQPPPMMQQAPVQHENPVNVQGLQYESFDSEPNVYTYSSDIDIIKDVPLEISVELGRTKKRISDILDFGPGTVIELDRLVGEALDILANGKLIAKGEVVVVDENYGVKLTEIIMPDERLKKI